MPGQPHTLTLLALSSLRDPRLLVLVAALPLAPRQVLLVNPTPPRASGLPPTTHTVHFSRAPLRVAVRDTARMPIFMADVLTCCCLNIMLLCDCRERSNNPGRVSPPLRTLLNISTGWSLFCDRAEICSLTYIRSCHCRLYLTPMVNVPHIWSLSPNRLLSLRTVSLSTYVSGTSGVISPSVSTLCNSHNSSV